MINTEIKYLREEIRYPHEEIKHQHVESKNLREEIRKTILHYNTLEKSFTKSIQYTTI